MSLIRRVVLTAADLSVLLILLIVGSGDVFVLNTAAADD